MNKLEIMKQKSIDILVEEMVKFQPGITSTRLWETAKDWYGKVVAQGQLQDFERALVGLRAKGYRVTNKQWYPAKYVAPPQAERAQEGRR